MGFFYNLPFVIALSVGTALLVAPALREGITADLARRAEPVLRPLLAFFGVAELPPPRVLGWAGAAAGAGGLLLNALAHALFGGPSLIFAINSLATATALGVAVTKLHPGAAPPDSSERGTAR